MISKSLIAVAVLVAAALVVSSVDATSPSYAADVVIYNDEEVPNSVLRGRMYYAYYLNDPRNVNTLHWRRIDYSSPTQMTDIRDYARAGRYKYCTTCSAFFMTGEIEPITPQNNTTPVPDSTYPGCTQRYTDADGTIYWMSATGVDTAAGSPCRVEYTSGKVIEFSNVVRITTTTSPVSNAQYGQYFSVPAYMNCPEAVCTAELDLALVVDRSSSINAASWKQQYEFIDELLKTFSLGTSATLVSLTTFTESSILESGLTDQGSSLVNILKSRSPTGYTCIGCGITVGLITLNNSPRKQYGVMQMMITFTDGINNRPSGSYSSNLTNSANNMKNAGVFSISIGVGTAPRESELKEIASELPNGEKATFSVANYAALTTILNDLVKMACTSFDHGGDCSVGCGGFCGCDDECICPECMNITANNCSSISCEVTQLGSSLGCYIYGDHSKCPDPSRCTESVCTYPEGCILRNSTVPYSFSIDYPKCYEAECTHVGGWFAYPSDANCAHLGDGTCSVGYCTDEADADDDGCKVMTKDCGGTPPICKEYYCNPVAGGCQLRDLVCPDDPNDPCNKGYCDSSITDGDPCTYKQLECGSDMQCFPRECEPTLGVCVTVPVQCDGSDDSCEHVGCDDTTGTCKTTTQDNCVHCMETDVCSADDDFCYRYECDEPTDGSDTPTCRSVRKYPEYIPPCKTFECDYVNQEFIFVDEPAPENPQGAPTICDNYVCDPITGLWDWDGGCGTGDNTDSCAWGECQSDGTCVYHRFDAAANCPIGPVDPSNQCVVYDGTCSIDPDTNIPGCTIVEKSCDTGNMCAEKASCIPETGECPEVVGIECGEAITPCFNKVCYGNTGCIDEARVTDDIGMLYTSNCTEPVCDNATGIFSLELLSECIPVDDCHSAYCVQNECRDFGELMCEITSPSACFEPKCVVGTGGLCEFEVRDDAIFDECGNCIALDTENEGREDSAEGWEDLNLTALAEECLTGMTLPPSVIAAISAGAIAGIVIAAVIVLALLGVSSVFGAKEVMRRAKLAKDQAAVNNPLYETSEHEGANPLFVGEEGL